MGLGINCCINGNCALPDETDVVDSGCFSAVSVFTVDYDVPAGADLAGVRERLLPLVAFQGSGGWKKHSGWAFPISVLAGEEGCANVCIARDAPIRHPRRHE